MSTTHPAPYYRCLTAQLYLLAAIATLWLHWHVTVVDSLLTVEYPQGERWWLTLELVLRIGLLPALTSLLLALASFQLDRSEFIGVSLLVGPLVALARWVALDTTTYAQWLLYGTLVLVGYHFLAKIRIYLSTCGFWRNHAAQRELVIDEYDLLIKRQSQGLRELVQHLLPEECDEFYSLCPPQGEHSLFAPSVREAKWELRHTLARLAALKKLALRRQSEPLAKRRRTLKKLRKKVTPLLEATRKKNPDRYRELTNSKDYYLFHTDPTPDQW